VKTAVALLVAATAVPIAAQDKPKKSPPEPVVLTGCIARDTATPTVFNLKDEKGQTTHRLTGMNMRGYVGQRVEIIGDLPDSKRLKIKTGLLPNPNVAAQAGSMDPSRAATAATGGSAPVGDVQLPEFRVKSVKPLSGGCG